MFEIHEKAEPHECLSSIGRNTSIDRNRLFYLSTGGAVDAIETENPILRIELHEARRRLLILPLPGIDPTREVEGQPAAIARKINDEIAALLGRTAETLLGTAAHAL